MSTQQEINTALTMGAKAFHDKLASGLALGRGAKVSVGALECEARVARKAGDLGRAGDLRCFLDEVYSLESAALEVVDADGSPAQGISPETAKFFLGRNRAVAKLCGANGANEYLSVVHGQYWKSTASLKEVILTLAIAGDSGPGELPASIEEAKMVLGGQTSLAWPGYVASLKRYVETFDASGHDDKLWHGVTKAHSSSGGEWVSTVADRIAVVEYLSSTLGEAVEAAKSYNPEVFVSGDDTRDFVAAYCPGLLHLVHVVSEVLV